MQPQVIAALITASANVGTSVFQKWTRGPKTSEDIKGEEFVKKHYDDYRTLIGNTSAKLLLKMEDGNNRTLQEIRRLVYPSLTFQSREAEDLFDEEFKFRLSYLELTGLITHPSEYFITKAGMTFLGEAKSRKDYYEVFFHQAG